MGTARELISNYALGEARNASARKLESQMNSAGKGE